MASAPIVRAGAAPGSAAQALAPLREFLAFRLADERYGVEIGRVGAIVKIPPVTAVPRAPEEVLGVVSVRGKVLAMLDLRRRLRLPEPPPTRAARILVLPSPDRDPVALYVDHVLHVQRLADSEIEPPETAFGSECGEHLIGLGRQGGVLLVLIDVEPLLGSWARRP